jgi:DNA-directed RNA polymerase subunit beta
LLGNKTSQGGDIPAGQIINEALLEGMPQRQWWGIVPQDEKTRAKSQALRKSFDEGEATLQRRFEAKSQKARDGLDLPPGVMKVVKIFVAVKRKIQQGDKMAGRHGNKGVISRIMPVEDMPYREDGTPIDIVLNPLGVPSRMNVGQILETHMGWACAGMGYKIGEGLKAYQQDKDMKQLRQSWSDVYGETSPLLKKTDKEIVAASKVLSHGVPIATPVFDGADEKNITEILESVGFDRSGQVTLFDGRTGDAFSRPVTIGFIYILKLHHLVDEKIHARSIGPYSLVTQQPLGGKAKFGGQRFGEMEVWALEAYGAGYTLQEMLTIKSDDVAGRTKAYESIVQGEDTFTVGVPESFNVLVMEMRALGLNVDLRENAEIQTEAPIEQQIGQEK